MVLLRRRSHLRLAPAHGVAAPEVLPAVETNAMMLRVAAEAVVLQDRAAAVLERIRRHEPLGETARVAGPLSRRYTSLGEALPRRCAEPADEAVRDALAAVLRHHAALLSLAMELSAYEWRSPRLWDQVEALDGLGRPGRQLEDLYHHLAATG